MDTLTIAYSCGSSAMIYYFLKYFEIFLKCYEYVHRGQRACHITCPYSYRWLWVGIGKQTCVRGTINFNHWAIFSAPLFFFRDLFIYVYGCFCPHVHLYTRRGIGIHETMILETCEHVKHWAISPSFYLLWDDAFVHCKYLSLIFFLIKQWLSSSLAASIDGATR